MRISDWSSDVCSSDLQAGADLRWIREPFLSARRRDPWMVVHGHTPADAVDHGPQRIGIDTGAFASGVLTAIGLEGEDRSSEEHTSELQSLMRISYAVFCLKKKKNKHKQELTDKY